MREYLFDDKRSIWHTMLGLLVAVLGKRMPVLGALGIIVYVIYEVIENEKAVSTVGDVIEFIIGFMVGSLWW